MNSNLTITGHTQKIAVIGDPIKHSKSPSIHNTSFSLLGLDYVDVAHIANLDNIKEVVDGLKALDYVGWNITMPVKGEMCKLCDELSMVSKLSGAVNTVVNNKGKLYGTTTDGIGFLNSMKSEGIDPIGKKMTIIGCGGASTAIYCQCALDGVKEISLFNIKDNFYDETLKRLEKVKEVSDCVINLYDLNDKERLKKEISDSYLLLHATGVGMGKLENQSVIDDISIFRKDLIVADLIYSPRCTKLLSLAKKAGCLAVNGEGVLLYQAAASFNMWTSREMPVNQLKEILKINIRV